MLQIVLSLDDQAGIGTPDRVRAEVRMREGLAGDRIHGLQLRVTCGASALSRRMRRDSGAEEVPRVAARQVPGSIGLCGRQSLTPHCSG